MNFLLSPLLQTLCHAGLKRSAPPARAVFSRASSTASTSSSRVYDLSSPSTVDSSSPIHFPSSFSLSDHALCPSDLVIYPSFLDEGEQRVLLAAGLGKLDTMSDRDGRARKREWTRKNKGFVSQDGFLPDEAYEFQERHFDGVISGYRECTLTTWPSPPPEADLASILRKIYALLPSTAKSSPETRALPAGPLDVPFHLLTHLLHLSSDGYILPHVDNISASAGTIAGICLGARRWLELGQKDAAGKKEIIRVRLDPGCAYIQKGKVRYEWEHSIPRAHDDFSEEKGQRLSVMIRDRLTQ